MRELDAKTRKAIVRDFFAGHDTTALAARHDCSILAIEAIIRMAIRRR